MRSSMLHWSEWTWPPHSGSRQLCGKPWNDPVCDVAWVAPWHLRANCGCMSLDCRVLLAWTELERATPASGVMTDTNQTQEGSERPSSIVQVQIRIL